MSSYAAKLISSAILGGFALLTLVFLKNGDRPKDMLVVIPAMISWIVAMLVFVGAILSGDRADRKPVRKSQPDA